MAKKKGFKVEVTRRSDNRKVMAFDVTPEDAKGFGLNNLNKRPGPRRKPTTPRRRVAKRRKKSKSGLGSFSLQGYGSGI